MKTRFICEDKDWYLSTKRKGVVYVFGLRHRYPDGSRGLHIDNLRAIEEGQTNFDQQNRQAGKSIQQQETIESGQKR